MILNLCGLKKKYHFVPALSDALAVTELENFIWNSAGRRQVCKYIETGQGIGKV